MLKRRHFSVDTSSPLGEVELSTPAFGRQNGVFPALGRRNKASPAAPVASTLQNPQALEVSTPKCRRLRALESLNAFCQTRPLKLNRPLDGDVPLPDDALKIVMRGEDKVSKVAA